MRSHCCFTKTIPTQVLPSKAALGTNRRRQAVRFESQNNIFKHEKIKTKDVKDKDIALVFVLSFV